MQHNETDTSSNCLNTFVLCWVCFETVFFVCGCFFFFFLNFYSYVFKMHKAGVEILFSVMTIKLSIQCLTKVPIPQLQMNVPRSPAPCVGELSVVLKPWSPSPCSRPGARVQTPRVVSLYSRENIFTVALLVPNGGTRSRPRVRLAQARGRRVDVTPNVTPPATEDRLSRTDGDAAVEGDR